MVVGFTSIDTSIIYNVGIIICIERAAKRKKKGGREGYTSSCLHIKLKRFFVCRERDVFCVVKGDGMRVKQLSIAVSPLLPV